MTTTRLTVLTLLMLFVSEAAHAQGGGKGWLERLSGPGPYQGFDFQFPVGCLGQREIGPGPAVEFLPFWEGGRTEEGVENLKGTKGIHSVPLCFEVGRSELRSEEDELVNGIVLGTLWEARAYWKVSALLSREQPPWLDLGVAIGRLNFEGEDFRFGRWLLTPIRVVVRPFSLWPHDLGKIFYVYYRGGWLAGRLSSERFGPTTREFESNWEWVQGVGFGFDVTVLWDGPRR